MKVYGLLGKTLSHSFSKTYFTKKFAEENIAGCRYENFELADISQFNELLENTPSLAGLNVTIPYKEVVIPFLARFSHEVSEVGACNCIRIESDQSLTGYNTDVVGFEKSLDLFLTRKINKALVLGTGGASKAVQYVLRQKGVDFKVVSRGHANRVAYQDVNAAIIAETDLIINCTPLGTYPNVNEKPAIPYQYLTSHHFLFDLVYNPEQTAFLQEGAQKGALIMNGYDMLVLQAEESWKIWNR